MNFTKKEFRVEHTVTRGTQINRLNITKTNCSNRTFPLNDDQIAILMKLKEQEENLFTVTELQSTFFQKSRAANCSGAGQGTKILPAGF